GSGGPATETNVISRGEVTVVSSTITVSNINGLLTRWFINLEADDPRLPLLFEQTNQSPDVVNATFGGTNGIHFDLGTTNKYSCDPTGANPSLMPYTEELDHTNREGLASFYVKKTNYVSIAEIGYVHRGEQWKTFRLQPGGDGAVLDYLRV